MLGTRLRGAAHVLLDVRRRGQMAVEANDWAVCVRSMGVSRPVRDP